MAASGSGSGKRRLTPMEAFDLMSADRRIHLRKKGEPVVVEDGRYGAASHSFDALDVGSTAQMKREAATRGFANIQRLSGSSAAALDKEIDALRDLADRQRAVISHYYSPDLAEEFAARGEALAAGASPERYRTSMAASYESAAGASVAASGYDEFAQTSVVASRAGGRRAALEAYRGAADYDAERYGRLEEIHRLMSVTSSFVRGDTAGIASEHNDDPMGTRAQHPTASAMRAAGGGSNSSYAHRMRTGVMQYAEAAYVDSSKAFQKPGFEPLMADRQRARLDAATLSTTHMFNAPPSAHTFSAMGAEVPAKMPAISGSREIAKAMRSQGLAPSGSASMLAPPPSPRRSKDTWG